MAPYPLSEYRLSIKAGATNDSLIPVPVNHESLTVPIKSPHFSGHVMVRMKDYPALTCPTSHPLPNPKSTYFNARQRLYSISTQGSFTEDVNGNDVLFELDLSKPVKVPVGSNVALKIAKWLEPSLEYDLDGSMPFMNAPMVSTMSVLGVYEKEDFVERVLRKQKTVSEEEIKMDPLTWAFSDSHFLPEDTTHLTQKPFKAMKDRKKYFASLEHRKSVTIRAGDIVVMEFYDGHFDFNTMRLMLPGFSLNAYKHWDGHQIRFRCLSRDDKKRVYYTVVFDLEHVGPGHSQAVDSDSPVSFEPAQEEFFHDGSEGEVTKNE